MRSIPHLAVPFRLDRRGAARTVEQDTGEDIVSCVRVLLDTRPGERAMVPDYGLADPTFGYLEINDDVVEAVQAFEPRATVDHVAMVIDETGNADVNVELR